MLPHDPSKSPDPVLLLLQEVHWLLVVHTPQELKLRDRDLADRAFLNRNTVYRLRAQVLQMLNGAPQPLFPWPVLAALAWASAPQPAPVAFVRWFEKLYNLYNAAAATQQPKYGTTTEQRIAAKKYVSGITTDSLVPMPVDLLREEVSITPWMNPGACPYSEE